MVPACPSRSASGNWGAARRAGFKAPKYVEFLRALPLNATGKVMKDQLK
jgi:fatty-acyl-CoA synthase